MSATSRVQLRLDGEPRPICVHAWDIRFVGDRAHNRTFGSAGGGQWLSSLRTRRSGRVRRCGGLAMVVLRHVVAPRGGRGLRLRSGSHWPGLAGGGERPGREGRARRPGSALGIQGCRPLQVFREPAPLPGRGWRGLRRSDEAAFSVLNVADLPTVRAACDAAIDTARPPASTAVQMAAALFARGYLIEAEPGPGRRLTTAVASGQDRAALFAEGG